MLSAGDVSVYPATGDCSGKAMQKVVRVDGDRAVPEFLLHLPKPLVLGALALGELGDTLHTRRGPAPEKCLAMAHRGGRLVAPRTLQVLRGDVSEEAPRQGGPAARSLRHTRR